MTNNHAPVEQRHRDAAADLALADAGDPISPYEQRITDRMRAGEFDDWNDIQAFANFERDHCARVEATLREALETIAGPPEWDEENNGPEPYNPRWSAFQCRNIARAALSGARQAPFRCEYCGRPSNIDPEDQVPPLDNCCDEDHGWTSEQEEKAASARISAGDKDRENPVERSGIERDEARVERAAIALHEHDNPEAQVWHAFSNEYRESYRARVRLVIAAMENQP